MSKEDRETYDAMKKAKKLLSNVLEAGRGGVRLSEVEEHYKGKKETAEKSTETRYSIQNVGGKNKRHHSRHERVKIARIQSE